MPTPVALILEGMHPIDFIRPLHGGGYQFWSGIGSDLGELSILLTILAFAWAWWRTHNCHIHKCPRLMWHTHPDHGHPVCRRHHPDWQQVTEDGIPGSPNVVEEASSIPA
jgi:hypothetical protein